MTKQIDIRRVSGRSLADYIPDIARLRITVFREWPYIYDGSIAYEEEYLKTYTDCTDAVVVLAMDDGKVVGASTALPMQYEEDAFKRPLIDAGYAIDKVYYCAESVLLPAYRGTGIGWRFFDEREAHARAIGDFDISCFCAVDRPANHPLRPADYTPLDSLWQKRGYVKQELHTRYRWKDLDEAEETDKPMVYWIKDLKA